MDQDTGAFGMTLASSVLGSLERTYGLALKVYLNCETVGLRSRLSAPIPVVSIGNLSVGGTGKTPAVIMLANVLRNLGLNVAVLSRGHGGAASSVGAAVSDLESNILISTDQSGDEPMVLALALPGIPVIVGKDRRKTAALAIQRFHPDILLLDDGFQYWQLKRDLDIVLLDASKPFENGRCLPRGLLREPKENLNRAAMVLVTRSYSLDPAGRDSLSAQIKTLAPAASVYFSQHVGGRIYPANSCAEVMVKPERPLAICAIGRPQSFIDTLSKSGVIPAGTLFLPDHHRYRSADVALIVGKMKEFGANSVITTEKDNVKLGKLMKSIPLFVQPVLLQVEREDDFTAEILQRAVLPHTLNETVEYRC